MSWLDAWNGKLVGFVVETRKGEFKPFIGRCIAMHEDDDCLIHVVGSQMPQETIHHALAFYAPDNDKFERVFKEPQESGGMMGHWLRPMLAKAGEKPWTA